MKKIGVTLAVAFIVSSAAWAQSFGDFPLELNFDAVQTQSVEKAYSAGLFDSDVDNYIDPTFFDGQIGTFMFAGGFHGGYEGPSNNWYSYPDPDDGTVGVSAPNYLGDTISVGFAKSLGTDKYLAAYYGGNFVNAYGKKRAGDKDDGTRPNYDEAEIDAVWNNKLAVLFGLGSMGFRLDLIMDNTVDAIEKNNKKVSSQKITTAPALALSWGTTINDKIFPWAKLGFKFADTEVLTTFDDGKVDKKVTINTDAVFLFNAGASVDLNETSSFSADLNVGGLLADSVKGDVKDFYVASDPSATPPVEGFLDGDKPYTKGGSFFITLDADYTKALTFGENTTVKIQPNLGVKFGSQSNNSSLVDDKSPSDDIFVLGAGVNIGGEYRYDKIALYTGLGLRFFEWTTYGHSGGKTKDGDTSWKFRGLAWDNDAFGNDPAAATLRLGLTFTPIEGLVFGAGAKLPIINPVDMTIGTTYPSGVAATGYTGNNYWLGTEVSVTVSYKFSSKPKEAKEAKEAARTEE